METSALLRVKARGRGDRARGRLRMRGGDRSSGFTLIELMVTIAVAAVLLVIAVPSFRSITLSNRLNTTANDIIASLNTARMEAIKGNASAQFCSNSATANTTSLLGKGCGSELGAVYVTTGSTATKVRSGPTTITDAIQLSGDAAALRYDGDGIAKAVGSSSPFNNTVVDICTSALTKENHREITMVGGSILQTEKKTATCP
ncbi:GspH/FimT family pseudopilin [Dyella sp.]|uniref:GspH/FimT family pseudopilin n=1 Tax=Dyella sp. TaxID=1869338 RepID=UPI003F7FB433